MVIMTNNSTKLQRKTRYILPFFFEIFLRGRKYYLSFQKFPEISNKSFSRFIIVGECNLYLILLPSVIVLLGQ